MRTLPLLLCVTLAACGGDAAGGDPVSATGEGGRRSYAARDFTAIVVAGVDDVEVRTAGDFSVVATATPAVLDRLRITREGDTLRIGRRPGNWSWSRDDSARITVTMPALRSGTIAGSGNLTVDRVQGDFAATVAGSGDLTVGMLDGGTTRAEIAGSGTFAAAGEVAALDVAVAGSGDIDAGQLRAARASVSVVGSGDVRAQVNGDAEVSLMGSGAVDLGSTARCRVSKMGSGEARCGTTQ